jgi:hypothetical protein
MKHFYLFVVICFLSNSLRAKEIYSILCGDTQDAAIKTTCIKDLKLVRDVVTDLVLYAEYKPIKREVKGKDFTVAYLYKVLEEITPKSDDVIIFYFTGHGIEDKLKFKDKYLEIDTLKAKLKVENARLTIITLDRCDKKLKKNNASKYKPREGSKKTVNADKLLTAYKGVYIFYSSEKGKFSYARKDGSSFFTSAWVSELKKMLNSDKMVSWSELLVNTRKNVEEALNKYPNIVINPTAKKNIKRRSTFNIGKKPKVDETKNKGKISGN